MHTARRESDTRLQLELYTLDNKLALKEKVWGRVGGQDGDTELSNAITYLP